MQIFVNSILYSVGWFIAVLGGAYGYSFSASFIVCAMIVGFLAFEKKNELQIYYNDLILVIVTSFLGILMEIIFIHFKFLFYTTPNLLISFFPPIWIVIIYALFALTINHSLNFFMNNLWKALVFGAIGGVLSEWGGAKLGAVQINVSFYILGLFWGVFLFTISCFNESLKKNIAKTFAFSNDAEKVNLLFDGDCPICTKEVSLLKNNSKHLNVNYIDIANKKNHLLDAYAVSYENAMKEMHLTTNNGKIYKGIDAFRILYAKEGLFFLSILYDLPIVKEILRFFYKIFAKNRLKLTGRQQR